MPVQPVLVKERKWYTFAFPSLAWLRQYYCEFQTSWVTLKTLEAQLSLRESPASGDPPPMQVWVRIACNYEWRAKGKMELG